jgi:hypothetical protein
MKEGLMQQNKLCLLCKLSSSVIVNEGKNSKSNFSLYLKRDAIVKQFL